MLVVAALIVAILVPRSNPRGFVSPDATQPAAGDPSTWPTYIEPINRLSVKVPDGWVRESGAGNLYFHPETESTSSFYVGFIFWGPAPGVGGPAVGLGGCVGTCPSPSGTSTVSTVAGRTARETEGDGDFRWRRYDVDWSGILCSGCKDPGLTVIIAGSSVGSDPWTKYLPTAESLLSTIEPLPLAQPVHGTIADDVPRGADTETLIAFLEQRVSTASDRYADRFLSSGAEGRYPTNNPYGFYDFNGKPFVAYKISHRTPCEDFQQSTTGRGGDCANLPDTASFSVVMCLTSGCTFDDGVSEEITISPGQEKIQVNEDGVYGYVVTEAYYGIP